MRNSTRIPPAINRFAHAPVVANRTDERSAAQVAQPTSVGMSGSHRAPALDLTMDHSLSDGDGEQRRDAGRGQVRSRDLTGDATQEQGRARKRLKISYHTNAPLVCELSKAYIDTESLVFLSTRGGGGFPAGLSTIKESRDLFRTAAQTTDSIFALSRISIMQAKAGFFSDAKETAEKIPSNEAFSKVATLVAVAEAEWKAGFTGQAKDTLQKAFYTANDDDPSVLFSNEIRHEAVDLNHFLKSRVAALNLVARVQSDLSLSEDAEKTLVESHKWSSKAFSVDGNINIPGRDVVFDKVLCYSRWGKIYHKLGKMDTSRHYFELAKFNATNFPSVLLRYDDYLLNPVSLLMGAVQDQIECGHMDLAESTMTAAEVIPLDLLVHQRDVKYLAAKAYVEIATKQVALGFKDHALTNFNNAKFALNPWTYEGWDDDLDQDDFEGLENEFEQPDADERFKLFLKIALAEQRSGFNSDSAETFALVRGAISSDVYSALLDAVYLDDAQVCARRGLYADALSSIKKGTNSLYDVFPLVDIAIIEAKVEPDKKERKRLLDIAFTVALSPGRLH